MNKNQEPNEVIVRYLPEHIIMYFNNNNLKFNVILDSNVKNIVFPNEQTFVYYTKDGNISYNKLNVISKIEFDKRKDSEQVMIDVYLELFKNNGFVIKDFEEESEISHKPVSKSQMTKLVADLNNLTEEYRRQQIFLKNLKDGVHIALKVNSYNEFYGISMDLRGGIIALVEKELEEKEKVIIHFWDTLL